MNKKNVIKENWILLVMVVVLVLLPLMLIQDSEFGGADGQAEGIITEVQADYEPWIAPLLQPPGGETESLLFALQAALGSGVMCYCLGYLKGRKKQSDGAILTMAAK